MNAYLILDTNALPIKGNFESAFWSAVFTLCDAKGIVAAVSEVSLHEGVNLRRVKAAELIEEYGSAHSRLSAVIEMPPAYLPSADDVAQEYESELELRFEVLPLDGEDARAALHREALRLPPARDGIGARDTAIWLTVVRLLADGHTVHLVTNNSRDFGKDGLSPSMGEDIDGLAGELHYHRDVNAFLDAIASKIASPTIDPDTVLAAFEESLRFSTIGALLADDQEHSPDDVLDGHLKIQNLLWTSAYAVDGVGLAMVRANFTLADSPEAPDWASGRITGWLSFDPTSLAVEPSEIDQFAVDFR
ncbi:PIN domain-containing protein [Microbacterium trichothecenolyticum]